MRELERIADHQHPPLHRDVTAVSVVGAGRMGTALATALSEAGYDVGEPLRRGEIPSGADAVLLCVPDAEIPAAAEALAGSAAFLGHTSGATPLTALDPARAQAFGLHPLQTVAGSARFEGCGCATAGSTPEALELADRMARDLGMLPFEVQDHQRAAYHAAASIASNFLVTLQAEAEALTDAAGIEGFDARQMLGPLVRRTVENWIALGPQRALTGPVARGDHATVAAQRAAIAAQRPQLEPLFDRLVERTEALTS
jgi:predicted short-subunit dehydrogenase-like oxidoreductase (DUF2520 family)